MSWDWGEGNAFPLVHRWPGTRDPSALLAVPAAIDFQAEHDWLSVRARGHALLERFRDASGLEPLADRFSQMLGFRLPVADGDALKLELYDRHRIEVPVFQTAGGWVLRVSIQGYNEEADVEALLGALAGLLPRGPRP